MQPRMHTESSTKGHKGEPHVEQDLYISVKLANLDGCHPYFRGAFCLGCVCCSLFRHVFPHRHEGKKICPEDLHQHLSEKRSDLTTPFGGIKRSNLTTTFGGIRRSNLQEVFTTCEEQTQLLFDRVLLTLHTNGLGPSLHDDHRKQDMNKAVRHDDSEHPALNSFIQCCSKRTKIVNCDRNDFPSQGSTSTLQTYLLTYLLRC